MQFFVPIGAPLEVFTQGCRQPQITDHPDPSLNSANGESQNAEHQLHDRETYYGVLLPPPLYTY